MTQSQLGTKDHWDSVYRLELNNFESFGHLGDVWYGQSVQTKLVEYLVNKLKLHTTSEIGDVGCGNGSFLAEMFSHNYLNLTGIDYSNPALAMASSSCPDEINWQQCDILSDLPQTVISKFDLILDKGTFDAISLMSKGRESMQIYKQNIPKFLKSGKQKLFVILSCNFTKEELIEQFSSDFVFLEEINLSEKFTFGGVVGKTVTGVVFEKINV